MLPSEYNVPMKLEAPMTSVKILKRRRMKRCTLVNFELNEKQE